MSSNNTRRIFVNVLVNGNIYQKRVAIDIQEDDFVIKSYGLDHYLKEWLVINYHKIPSELLSYEIVNEVTEKQSDALLFIFNRVDKHSKCQLHGSDDRCLSLWMDIPNIGQVTIHAKDIAIKD